MLLQIRRTFSTSRKWSDPVLIIVHDLDRDQTEVTSEHFEQSSHTWRRHFESLEKRSFHGLAARLGTTQLLELSSGLVHKLWLCCPLVWAYWVFSCPVTVFLCPPPRGCGRRLADSLSPWRQTSADWIFILTYSLSDVNQETKFDGSEDVDEFKNRSRKWCETAKQSTLNWNAQSFLNWKPRSKNKRKEAMLGPVEISAIHSESGSHRENDQQQIRQTDWQTLDRSIQQSSA